jgi:hypothetical protein
MTAIHYDRTLQFVTGLTGGAEIVITRVTSTDGTVTSREELGFALTHADLRKLEKHLRKARITKRKITTLRY